MAAGDGWTPREERNVGHGWRGGVSEAVDDAGYGETTGKLPGRSQRHVGLAPHQNASVRAHRQGGRGSGLHHGLGQQRSHLGARIGSLG